MEDKLQKLFEFAVNTLICRETTSNKLLKNSFLDLVGNFYENKEKTGIKLLKVSEDEFYDIYENYWDYAEKHIKAIRLKIQLNQD